MSGAQGASGFDKFHFAHHHHRGANDTRRMRSCRDGQRKDHIDHRRTQDRTHGDRQNDGGESHTGVHQPHEGAVQAPEVTRTRADQHASQGRDDGHHEPDLQRNACAMQHPRQDVAAELIGTHPMLQTRRHHPGPEVALERVKRGDDTGQQGQQQYQPNQGRPDGE